VCCCKIKRCHRPVKTAGKKKGKVECVCVCWTPNEALSSLEDQEEVYGWRETGGLETARHERVGKWVKESF